MAYLQLRDKRGGKRVGAGMRSVFLQTIAAMAGMASRGVSLGPLYSRKGENWAGQREAYLRGVHREGHAPSQPVVPVGRQVTAKMERNRRRAEAFARLRATGLPGEVVAPREDGAAVMQAFRKLERSRRSPYTPRIWGCDVVTPAPGVWRRGNRFWRRARMRVLDMDAMWDGGGATSMWDGAEAMGNPPRREHIALEHWKWMGKRSRRSSMHARPLVKKGCGVDRVAPSGLSGQG